MFWTLTFQLMPDEKILEDSSARSQGAIKPVYSVFLTNKRAIFRFDGLGSSLTQSFHYEEILDVKPSKRLFFTYLKVRAGKREFLLNVGDAEYWTTRIQEIKNSEAKSGGELKQAGSPPERTKRELLDMITVLRKYSLLTDEELEKKVHLLDSLRF